MSLSGLAPKEAARKLPDPSRRSPDFLILGAQKAGTTALYHALARHGGVWMSPVKETRHFLSDGRVRQWKGPGAEEFSAGAVWDSVDYAALFSGASEGMPTGEATPAYLAASESAGVAERVMRTKPSMRLIVLLRNPAERAFSAFLHHRRLGLETERDFGCALEREEGRMQDGWLPGWGYRRNGCYAECLTPYLERFPRGQVLVLAWEEWNAEPERSFRTVCRFLGVEERLPERLSERHNESLLPRFRLLARWRSAPHWLVRLNVRRPVMDAAVRQRLLSDYASDIGALEALTGVEFSESWR